MMGDRKVANRLMCHESDSNFEQNSLAIETIKRKRMTKNNVFQNFPINVE